VSNDKDGDYYFFDQGKLKINKEDIKNTKQQSVDSNYGISYEVSGKWATLFEFGYLNSDLLIEQKLLNESGWFIFAQYNPFQLLNLEYSYVQGNAVDFDNARQGYSKSGILTISSTVGMHFTLSAAIENEVLDINGEQLFDASIYDLRGTWFFNADHSLRVVTRFQDYKQNAALYTFPVDNRYRELSSQLTYRYQIDPYTLLFAGYSSGALSNDRYRNFKQNDRTIFLKASYAYGF